MSINYKPEVFESTYTFIESMILKIDEEGFLGRGIKMTYDKKLLNFISYLDINILERNDKYISVRLRDVIIMSFVIKLMWMGLSKVKSKIYVERFFNNYSMQKYKFLMDFYLLQSLLDQEINFYIYWEEVSIMSMNEFIVLKKKFSLNEDLIVINFNKIMHELTHSELYLGIKADFYIIEDNVKAIIEKFYDKNFKKIRIEKDSKWYPFLLKSETTFPWETKFIDLVNKFPFAEIVTKVNNNKVRQYIVREFKKFF